jgi:hypothetical protein
MLPPKNPQEEKKHLQEYEAMMKKAKKLELKKQKEYEKKREQKDRRVKHALYVWEKDIIPNWKARLNQTRTIVLWNQGIPARCRKKVWALRIGNTLNITKSTFNECVKRVPQSVSTNHRDSSHGAPMPILSSNTKLYDPYSDGLPQDPSLYSLRNQHSKTSSLNVLQENDSSSYSLNSIEESANDDSVDGTSTVDLGSNSSSRVDDIGLEDDIDDDDSTSQEEEDIDDDITDDKIITDSATINYLNKAIDEDILRTLPSLCVFQVKQNKTKT